MNYKQIVKQTEEQQQAVASVKLAVLKNKISILKKFSKPIFEYLLYIQDNPEYRFSAEAHFYKGKTETSPLFTVWKASLDKKEKEPYAITSAKAEIEKGFTGNMLTRDVSYMSGCIKIYFGITDEFVPSIYYEYGKARFQFTDPEEFVKSFTELLIKYRR